MNITSIHTAFYYSPYIQYSIAFILLLLFFMRSPRTVLDLEELVIYSSMFVLCVVSYINGISMGYSVNIKPFVLTILLVFLNSRLLPVQYLKYFLYILVAFLVIEYLIAYSQVIPTFHSNYIRAAGLIRPVGLFLDFHLTSYAIVFSLLVLGYSKSSGLISMFFGSYQIVLGWFVAVLGKIKLIYIVISLFFIVLTLYSVGHFYLGEGSESMLSVLLNILTYDKDYQCFIFGCSTNLDSFTSSEGASVSDFGYYRILYQFGFLWIVLLIFSLRKYNKLFILANIAMWVHYPISLGILGFIIFIYFLHCIKYKEYIDDNKKVKAVTV